jgi:DNA-binding MarR family transcriptional regulator
MTDRVEQATSMEASDPRRIAASIAMFERLVEHWSLRRDERETLLGGVPKSTWSEWKQRPALARLKADTRERIANLYTIDLNAHSLFAPEFADRWVRGPNAAFQGQSPLSAMLRGKVEDVIGVRRYLERIRTSSPADISTSDDHGTANKYAVSYLPDHFLESADTDAGDQRKRSDPVATCKALYVAPDVYALAESISHKENRAVSALIEKALAIYDAEREAVHAKPKTVLPALVLHMLLVKPDSGYGLIQRLDSLGVVSLAKPNTIYPLLRRLEERGFVRGEPDSSTKRGTMLYRLTKAGTERLESVAAIVSSAGIHE